MVQRKAFSIKRSINRGQSLIPGELSSHGVNQPVEIDASESQTLPRTRLNLGLATHNYSKLE